MPIKYIDKWTNNYNLNYEVELSIKQTLIEFNIYDKSFESSYSYFCQPSGVKIDYNYDRARDKYGVFIAYTLLLFPSSIFGNQTVYVKCDSNKEIEYWSFSDPFTDIYQECTKHRIKFMDGDYLMSTTCKYFKE